MTYTPHPTYPGRWLTDAEIARLDALGSRTPAPRIHPATTASTKGTR